MGRVLKKNQKLVFSMPVLFTPQSQKVHLSNFSTGFLWVLTPLWLEFIGAILRHVYEPVKTLEW